MPTMPSMPSMPPMPSSVGYSSLYAGDMHVMSPNTRHPTTTPRGYTTTTTANGVPTTTRTYAVTRDPRLGPTVGREQSRNRRSTLDSTNRPPVIVTTTQADRQQGAHQSNHSPIRNPPRASDGHLYAQPASSIRSRSTAPSHGHRPHDTDDYARGRDRDRPDAALAARDAEAYRSSRPSVIYPSDPRHSTATVDLGDEGYQYTNAGELARYDLDHTMPARRSQRESLDRGYYRPNVSYNTDQRSFNVNTSADLSRNYSMNTSRPYEGPASSRGGPPPSTRGFDRIDRAFESTRDVPPTAPVPPSPSTSRAVEVTPGVSEHRDIRRPRPVSLYQDTVPRSSHHDEYYRSREDERTMREMRDRERESERTRDAPYFRDESVTSRGFGIRTAPLIDDYDDRRRRGRVDDVEEPPKRSNEELLPDPDAERERRRRSWLDDREQPRERWEGRRASDEDRSRFRDKIVSGAGIAAAAMGLVPPAKDDDSRDSSDKEPRRRRSPTKDRDPQDEAIAGPSGSDERDRYADRPKDRNHERDRAAARDEADRKEHRRPDDDEKFDVEFIGSGSDSDGGKKASRRNRAPAGFNPNDANDISNLREQLASMSVSEKEPASTEPAPAEMGPSPSQSPPIKDRRVPDDEERDESRGREMALVRPDEKTVRVVSPPREKREEKPLKSILKQPSARFPEGGAYIREGVAPHKDDKKTREVPPGARWTKISRKVVNPEALEVGQERFEIRDNFVIVLRVLSREEIEAYAEATKVLRRKSYPMRSLSFGSERG